MMPKPFFFMPINEEKKQIEISQITINQVILISLYQLINCLDQTLL
jgi:hypothetical protein